MRYEFVTLELSLDHKMYLFTTNNVKGFKEILDKKYEEIKDTEEYKKYHGLDSKYYDDKYYFELGEYQYDY